jgi:hypothetical protein
MNTILIKAEINPADLDTFKILLKKFKAKNIEIQETYSPKKITKEQFYAEIEKGLKEVNEGKTIEVGSTEEEIRKFFEAI